MPEAWTEVFGEQLPKRNFTEGREGETGRLEGVGDVRERETWKTIWDVESAGLSPKTA